MKKMIEQLRQYDSKLNPIYQDTQDILMLSSSSAGNSLFIKPYRTLIDLGLPYKYYSNELLMQINYICLTHEHGDHLNVAAMNFIMRDYPHIQFIMRRNLYDKVVSKFNEKSTYQLKTNVITIIESNQTITLDLPKDDVLIITGYKTNHRTIENTAYTLKGSVDVEGYEMPHILYASDLISTQDLPQDESFELLFLEANYDEEQLLERVKVLIEAKQPHLHQHQYTMLVKQMKKLDDEFDAERLNALLTDGIFAPKEQGNLRHLSESQAFHYMRRHLTDDGRFIPLHASDELGTFNQNKQ